MISIDINFIWVLEDMYLDEKKNIRIIDINQIGDQQKNYKFNGCDLDHNFTKMYLNAFSYNPEYKIPQQCKKYSYSKEY